MSNLFSISASELEQIELAVAADIAEAREYSSIRNPEFSSWDKPVFARASSFKSQLLALLSSDPGTAERLSRLGTIGHSELGSRLRLYAQQRREVLDAEMVDALRGDDDLAWK